MGYEIYLLRLYSRLSLTASEAELKEWCSLDKRRSSYQKWSSSEDVRKRMANRRKEKIKAELKKLAGDTKKGKGYGKGCGGPGNRNRDGKK